MSRPRTSRGLGCRAAAAGLAATLVVLLGPAAGGAPPVRAGQQVEAESVQEQIDVLRRKLEELRGERSSVLRDFEAADVALALRRQELGRLQRREAYLSTEIAERTARVEELEEGLAEAKEDLARRVVALYRMGPLSYSRLLLSAESARDLLTGYRLVVHLAAEDRELILTVDERRRSLEAARQEMAVTREALAETRAEVEVAVAALERQQRERRRLLSLIDREAETMRLALAEREREAARLEGMVGRLAEEEPAPADAGEAGPASRPLADDPTTEPSVDAGTEASPDPGDGGAAAAAAEGVAGAAAASFGESRGRLPWPGEGPVVVSFGRHRHPVYDTYTVSKGIEIDAAEGAPVRAVWPGRVRFADWWTGYGLLVIVDHGGDFFTLYGHLSTVETRVNARVEQGDVVGRVGETGSLQGPSLYFEIRNGTQALNPLLWLEQR